MEQRAIMAGLEVKDPPPGWNMLKAQRRLQTIIMDAKAGAREHPAGEPAQTVGELLERIQFNERSIRHEFCEMEDWLPWKNWKTNAVCLDDPVEKLDEALVEVAFELVDVLHFAMNVAIALGLSWAELERLFYTKHLENISRQERGY